MTVAGGPVLSAPETCCRVLGFILQRNVVHLSEPSTSAPRSKGVLGGVGKEEELRLTTAQLPLQESSAKQHFQELLSSCAAAEIVSSYRPLV